VRLQDRGYVVVPVQQQVRGIQNAALEPCPPKNIGVSHYAMPQCMPPVKSTFIHYDLPPSTPSAPGARRRSSSQPGKNLLPKRTMSDSLLLEQQKPAAAGVLRPQERVRFWSEEPLGEEEEGSGNNGFKKPGPSSLPTPSPLCGTGRVSSLISIWEKAAAKSPGTPLRPQDRQNSWGDSSSGGGSTRGSACGERVRFCPGEPLVVDDGEESEETTSGEAWQPKQPFPLMTPSPQYGSKWLSSAAHAAVVNQNSERLPGPEELRRLRCYLGCAQMNN